MNMNYQANGIVQAHTYLLDCVMYTCSNRYEGKIPEVHYTQTHKRKSRLLFNVSSLIEPLKPLLLGHKQADRNIQRSHGTQ